MVHSAIMDQNKKQKNRRYCNPGNWEHLLVCNWLITEYFTINTCIISLKSVLWLIHKNDNGSEVSNVNTLYKIVMVKKIVNTVSNCLSSVFIF